MKPRETDPVVCAGPPVELAGVAVPEGISSWYAAVVIAAQPRDIASCHSVFVSRKGHRVQILKTVSATSRPLEQGTRCWLAIDAGRLTLMAETSGTPRRLRVFDFSPHDDSPAHDETNQRAAALH